MVGAEVAGAPGNPKNALRSLRAFCNGAVAAAALGTACVAVATEVVVLFGEGEATSGP